MTYAVVRVGHSVRIGPALATFGAYNLHRVNFVHDVVKVPIIDDSPLAFDQPTGRERMRRQLCIVLYAKMTYGGDVVYMTDDTPEDVVIALLQLDAPVATLPDGRTAHEMPVTDSRP